ncbi:MAG: WbqC family protein [Deltaproteobacteria bacterium]|nr:WbqC family protein [Deltaproteobacteria bacterium]
MVLAVHQPHYLPWPGLFHKMASADLFVFLDVVQYVPREWQNRNRIRTHQGTQWLTVPVHAPGRPEIREVSVDNEQPWAERHLRSLEFNYRPSPHYREVMGWLEPLLQRRWEGLSDLNIAVTLEMARALGVTTPTRIASDLGDLPTGPDRRIVALCERLGAEVYLSGSGGHHYMELEAYRAAGIRVAFHEFQPPVYPQLHGDPIPGLSAVDLLLQAGPCALEKRRWAA